MDRNKSSLKLDTITKTQAIQLLVACIAYVVVLLLPLEGLATAAQRALAALVWIIIVLITNCLPIMLSNCIFAALVIVSGAMTQGAFLTAFGTSPFMLCLGLGVVALGMSQTNLGARMAYTIMKTIGRTPSLLLLSVMITGFITSALIANLPALLAVVPIILSVLRAMDEEPGTSVMGKALFIGLIWSGGAGGLCFISSAATNAAGVAAISSATDGATTVSFAQFAMVGIPSGIVMLLSGWLILSLWFKLNKVGKKLDTSILNQNLKALGKMDAAELRYALYLVLLVVCFLFGGNYGINPPTVAIVFMAIMLCPGIGLVSWGEAVGKQNWAMLFQIGFFVGFASAVSSTGLGDWLSATLFGWVNTSNVLTMLIIITVLAHLANILVPGGGAALVLIPSVCALSSSLGVSAAYLAMMLYMTTQWSQFQPVQPQYLVVKGNTAGYMDVKDFIVPNIIASVIWTVLLIPVFYIMAPIAGLM